MGSESPFSAPGAVPKRSRARLFLSGGDSNSRRMTDALHYMTGFGGHFESGAVPGALPTGRNSPQRPAFGLYAEQLSGSSFTMARAENRRSWLYRMRPTADHRPFTRYDGAPLFAPGTIKQPLAPNRLRWDPLGRPARGERLRRRHGDDARQPRSVRSRGRGGSPVPGSASRWRRRVFVDADGELLIVPQSGALRICSRSSRLDVPSRSLCIIPRGVKFRVEVEGECRGYVAENHGLAAAPSRPRAQSAPMGSPIRVTSKPRSPGSRIATGRPK